MFKLSTITRSGRLAVAVSIFLQFFAFSFTVKAEQSFTLSTTPDQLISLRANQAPLRLVIEKIARELNIEVQARISDDERVTDEFRNVPLIRALKRMSHNYIYVTEKASGKVAKIFLLPPGEDAPLMVIEPRPPAEPMTAETENAEPANENTTAAIPPEKAEVATEGNATPSDNALPENDEASATPGSEEQAQTPE